MLKIIFILSTAFASPSVWTAGGKGGTIGYDDKATCERREGQQCYDVSTCSPDLCSVVAGVLQVDPAKQAAQKAKADAQAAHQAAHQARIDKLKTACANQTNPLLQAICDRLLNDVN